MLIGLATAMSPWWWRNYRLTGRFIPTTLQMGASLYDGLNPHATGASDMRFVDRFLHEQQQADRAAVAPQGTLEERLDRRMHQEAVEWARQHPMRAIELAMVKFLRMWSIWPNAKEFQSWAFRLAILAGYTPLMLAAIYGAWRHLRGGWPYALCVIPAVYLTWLHMVFVSSIRYREPAMFPLIVLAAGAWFPRRAIAETARDPANATANRS
jgi:hypothetical protein